MILYKIEPKFWILEKFTLDLIFFILPGIATIFFLPQLLQENEIGAFLIAGFFDAGHVYTTMWRTWLDQEERRRYKGYLIVPLVTFIIIVVWIVLRVPYLWSVLAYFTIYHNYRQFFGFTKWYEKLNARKCMFSGFMVQAVCLFPFVLFHFRSGVAMGYMTKKDLLVTPHPSLLEWGTRAYVLLMLIWLVLELDLVFRKKIFEPNRIFSILVPAILYGHGFLRGFGFVDIVYPLLVAHAMAYFGAMSLSLERIYPRRYTFLGAFKIILITAAVFGTLDFFYESINVVPDAYYQKMNWPISTAVLIAILLTPLICHYIFDSWIWRHYHPNAQKVFHTSLS